jgi:hypothetical protein
MRPLDALAAPPGGDAARNTFHLYFTFSHPPSLHGLTASHLGRGRAALRCALLCAPHIWLSCASTSMHARCKQAINAQCCLSYMLTCCAL